MTSIKAGAPWCVFSFFRKDGLYVLASLSLFSGTQALASDSANDGLRLWGLGTSVIPGLEGGAVYVLVLVLFAIFLVISQYIRYLRIPRKIDGLFVKVRLKTTTDSEPHTCYLRSIGPKSISFLGDDFFQKGMTFELLDHPVGTELANGRHYRVKTTRTSRDGQFTEVTAIPS